jgi:hypothetical protein
MQLYEIRVLSIWRQKERREEKSTLIIHLAKNDFLPLLERREEKSTSITRLAKNDLLPLHQRREEQSTSITHSAKNNFLPLYERREEKSTSISRLAKNDLLPIHNHWYHYKRKEIIYSKHLLAMSFKILNSGNHRIKKR